MGEQEWGSGAVPQCGPWAIPLVGVRLKALTGGQPNFARSLAVSWADTLYIHFWGLLPPNGILPPAKFTLRPSFAFSYIGSVTAWHSSSVRAAILLGPGPILVSFVAIKSLLTPLLFDRLRFNNSNIV